MTRGGCASTSAARFVVVLAGGGGYAGTSAARVGVPAGGNTFRTFSLVVVAALPLEFMALHS